MRNVEYFMGIDGGGSQVRVVITTPDLTVVSSAQGGSANPNSAGRDAAAQTIQETVWAALADARLGFGEIAAVGVGIAGTVTFRDWARDTVATALPTATIAIASDFEIALIGAQGERLGVLILAGTGSVAFGINAARESAQVGGWGYLLGDEGSGYSLGLKALQAVVRAADGRGQATRLTEAVLTALQLNSPPDLIQWVYTPGRTRDIARLAPLVLDAVDDPVAKQIVAESLDELKLAVQTVVRRLKINSPAFAFAGGLLTELNPLSRGLCAALGLSSIPVPKYSPVIGAALLALTQEVD
ncbi:MAG: BadF/BadG/BcrA/BcrD ATPase family protein [Chloroflexota bacterium]